MPWLATDPMIERLEIVQNAFSDCSTMADVCVRYGARVALLTANGTPLRGSATIVAHSTSHASRCAHE